MPQHASWQVLRRHLLLRLLPGTISVSVLAHTLVLHLSNRFFRATDADHWFCISCACLKEKRCHLRYTCLKWCDMSGGSFPQISIFMSSLRWMYAGPTKCQERQDIQERCVGRFFNLEFAGMSWIYVYLVFFSSDEPNLGVMLCSHNLEEVVNDTGWEANNDDIWSSILESFRVVWTVCLLLHRLQLTFVEMREGLLFTQRRRLHSLYMFIRDSCSG
jgi:hypothetical protein